MNLTGASITNVTLSLKGSDRNLSCDKVAKNSLCHGRFGIRRYPQPVFELSWIHGDGSEKSTQLSPQIPSYFSVALPLSVELEIDAAGSVNANYEQESRVRS